MDDKCSDDGRVDRRRRYPITGPVVTFIIDNALITLNFRLSLT